MLALGILGLCPVDVKKSGPVQAIDNQIFLYLGVSRKTTKHI
jgi:hypothetical protein